MEERQGHEAFSVVELIDELVCCMFFAMSSAESHVVHAGRGGLMVAKAAFGACAAKNTSRLVSRF